MKMIVGLGNPGKEYENTRHNVGFMVLDNWMNKHNFTFDKNKLNGLYSIIKYNYKIDVNDLLVIYDDKDIALGSVKLKKNGSSAGHNGIKNIIENLKTEDFKRLKVGLSKNNVDMVSFVLGKFNNDERCKLNVVLNETNDILDDYFVMTFDNLMNKYNKKG